MQFLFFQFLHVMVAESTGAFKSSDLFVQGMMFLLQLLHEILIDHDCSSNWSSLV